MHRHLHSLLLVGLFAAQITAGCITSDDLGQNVAAVGLPVAADLVLIPLTTGLDRPVQFVPDPRANGNFLVAEMGGNVRTVDADGMTDVILNITDRLATAHREQGLLGLALHADFPDDPRLFVTYTATNDDVVLSSFTMSADASTVAAASEEILLRVPQYKPYHNGGHVTFGPDGFLYAAFGDGSPQGDPDGNAQNTSNLLGSIIRIDVDVDDGRGWSAPADNPFVGSDGRDEIWLYGMRNPWRFAFDDLTGDLWIGDVGFMAAEEIDLVPAALGGGHNLGWPRWEGNQPFAAKRIVEVPVLFPVHEYPRGDPCSSVTGGFVVHDPALPRLAGAYLYGDFCTGEIHALERVGGQWVSHKVFDSGLPIAGFGEGPDGGIYVISYAGGIYRLAAAA